MNVTLGARLGQLPVLLRTCMRQVHTHIPPIKPLALPVKKKKITKLPERHGEEIWVFAHRRSDQIVFSFSNQLNGLSHRKQVPFNGKNTKAPKLRKDYWSPMAIIHFPSDMGEVGRSVYQKLRELKHLHEVQWPDHLRYKRPEDYTVLELAAVEKAKGRERAYYPLLNKQERGKELMAQRKNVIADMAVVLAGNGAGNKINYVNDEGEKKLVEVSVTWHNDLDRESAEAWSPNVSHKMVERGPDPSDDVVAAPPTEEKEET